MFKTILAGLAADVAWDLWQNRFDYYFGKKLCQFGFSNHDYRYYFF